MQVILEQNTRSKYESQVQIAQAIYLDSNLNLNPSTNGLNSFGSYFDSDSERLEFLKSNVYNALRTSDNYIWIYSETASRVDWWAGRSPSGAIQAMSSAMQSWITGQLINYDSIISAAEARVLYVSGSIKSATGAGADGVTVSATNETGSGDVIYCRTSAGYYICFIKSGWSGTVKVEKNGTTFVPSSLSFSNVTEKQFNQNFIASP